MEFSTKKNLPPKKEIQNGKQPKNIKMEDKQNNKLKVAVAG